MSDDPERTLTMVMRLPQPLDAFSGLLRHVGDIWPNAQVDVNHPEGWRVVIEADS